MNKQSIYVAGPMSNMPNFNFEAFDRATYTLRREGWVNVFNPAEKDRETYGDVTSNNPTGSPEQAKEEFGLDIRDVLSLDLQWICEEADAIYMLRGWENSKGARAEHATAHAIGIKIYYQEGH